MPLLLMLPMASQVESDFILVFVWGEDGGGVVCALAEIYNNKKVKDILKTILCILLLCSSVRGGGE